MSPPKNIFFLTDFYPAKKEQLEPRMEIARLAQKKGFKKFGGEFLFMNSSDVQNLKEQKKQAIQIKEKLDSLFDKTIFSIHAPWFSFEETAFELGKKQFQTVQQLLDFCPEFVKIINVHAGTVPLEYWNQKLGNHPEQKRKNFEIVKNQLGELADCDERICVETLFAPLDEEDGANYLANLPSDVLKLASHKKIGITVDTAHAGMTIESCKKMVRNKELYNGFFENEWSEIQTVAKNSQKEFTQLRKKIRHIHFNDYAFRKDQKLKSTLDGAIPGMGVTPKKELFEWLEALAKASEKKEIGATLEIKEKDYNHLENQKKTVEIMADYYGLKS